MVKKINPAEFPSGEYQGKRLSTMDVSLARIGNTALTLEEHQAGMSVIAPEPPKEKFATTNIEDINNNNIILDNVTIVDYHDPRLHGDFEGGERHKQG